MKARHAMVRQTILTEICKLNVLRNREEKSSRHVAMVAKFLDLNKPCSCKYGRKKKIDIYYFPIHGCTQEQNDRPYFPSILRQCKWPSVSGKIVEFQKFCYHGYVMSHRSSLYTLYLKKISMVRFINRLHMLRPCLI